MDTDSNPLHSDPHALRPAALWLRYDWRADGWTPGRQAAFLAHLADHGVVADAAKAVGKSLAGAYALRRRAAGYAFNLGWEAALLIARRIVADQVMACAIEGERAEWVREEGRTTYTRFNAKVATTLLDRVNPAAALNEVTAVAARFDHFLEVIDGHSNANILWDFFDCALALDDRDARNRVRASLLLCEESADFEDEEDRIEVKSMPGRRKPRSGFALAKNPIHTSLLRRHPVLDTGSRLPGHYGVKNKRDRASSAG